MAEAKFRSVLVTDFDGTLTEQDFYQLVRDTLVPEDTPDYWASYRNGSLTHFEALRAYFASARPDEEALVSLVGRMGLEPELPAAVSLLNEAGWKVVVVSSGCHWYIDLLLQQAGVALEVHANPGKIEGGRLAMHWPTGTSFPSKQTGVSKPAIVQSFLDEGRAVAYAGDGHTDADAAVLVPPDRRFARRDLAEALRGRGQSFRPFSRWMDVARALAEGGTA
jgi:2,3-diketo-5-methylthio-1-phosphopentane phosphatase